MAGSTTAPASATAAMFRSWASPSGVSRGTNTSFRRSFRWTSAARWIRFSLSPWATAASVPMLHGQTAIPPVRNEPLAMPARKFRKW